MSDALLFTHESACKVNSHSTYFQRVVYVYEKVLDLLASSRVVPFVFFIFLSVSIVYITQNMQLSKCKEILYLIRDIFFLSASSD